MPDPYTVVSTSNSAMIDYPLWMQAGGTDAPLSYSAVDFRRLTDLWRPNEGVNSTTSFFPQAHPTTPSMVVLVSTGSAIISTTSTNGKYAVATTGAVSIPVPTAVGGTYLHRLVAEIIDAQALSSTGYGWQFRVVQGSTPNVLPASPANSITIAQVKTVPGQTSVTAADVTDLRWPSGDNATVVVSRTLSTATIGSGSTTSPNFDTAEYDPWSLWDSAVPSQIKLRSGFSGVWDFTVTGWLSGTASSLSNKHVSIRLGIGGQPTLDDDVGLTGSTGFRSDLYTGTLTDDGIALPPIVANGVKFSVGTSLTIKPYISPNGTITLRRLRLTAQRRVYSS